MQKADDSSPTIYARETELACLHRWLDQALAGRAAICFVTGEAGAGKSALLEAFAFEAKARLPELVIAAGDCNPHTGSDEPYLPFREILSDLTEQESHQSGPDRVERPSNRFLQAARNVVTEHGPDLIDIFIPGGALITRVGAQAAHHIRKRKQGEQAMPAPQIDIQQGHLFEQYTNVLCRLSRDKPLVLFIDDLHWADQASLDLLFHLGRRIGPEPILLVGAYRPIETLHDDRNGRLLAGKINEFKRYHGDVWVDLSDVERDQAMALTHSLVDAEPNHLDAAFRQALFERTEGHALFTVELLRHLKASGILSRGADGHWTATGPVAWEGLPARVEGIIEERVAGLQADDRRLLESASVLGDTFLAEVLAAMLGQPLRDIVRRLSGALSRDHNLVRAEGFERIGGLRAARYRFCHNLFREYFYQALDPIERVYQHESAALSLESVLGEAAESHAAQLAWHMEEADRPLDALRYHFAAGRQAQADYANAEALSRYRSVQKLLDLNGDTALDPRESGQLRRDSLSAMGTVQQLRGEFEDSCNSFRQALELTDASDRMACAELHRQLAGSLERQRQHLEAIAELESSARLLGTPADAPSDNWWSAWITVTMDRIRLHYWQGDPEAMAPLLDQLSNVIDQRGNAHQRCHFWTGQAMRGYRVERYRLSQPTRQACRNALEAAREGGNPLDLSNALFGMGFSHVLNFEPVPAISALTEAFEIAERCGDRHLRARNLAYLVHAHRIGGDCEAASRQLRLARPAAEELAMHDYIGLAMAMDSWLALRAGDRTLASERAANALSYWEAKAPRYPLQWTALVPMLEVAVDDADWSAMLQAVRKLLDPVQALPPVPVEAALSNVAQAAERSERQSAWDAAHEALQQARAAGFF